MTEEDYSYIKGLLDYRKNIIITTHKNPDGDAIGSSLGLYNYLIRKGHNVQMIVPDAYPDFLTWMQGSDKIIVWEENKILAKSFISKAEIIFSLDYNGLGRIGSELGELVNISSAIKIMIDHHQQPEDFVDYKLSDTSACSTAQLVYDFVENLGDKKMVTMEMGECLYAGIITDSGNFRFPSTSSRTHRIVAELIDRGIKFDEVYNAIYNNSSIERIRLLGKMLNENLQLLNQFKAAYFALSIEDQKKFNYKKGDMEGVVNYALTIKGISFAVFFTEANGFVKMSFRSKGNFNVNIFARENFDGGGHINAAGGINHDTLENTIQKFKDVLPNYRTQLIKA